jgi:hypothetical protein
MEEIFFEEKKKVSEKKEISTIRVIIRDRVK